MKDLNQVKEELNRLQTMEEISLEIVEQNCALVKVTHSPASREIDQTISDLHQKMDSLQHNKVSKLFSIYRICRYAAFANVKETLETDKHVSLESGKHIF